jgi:hypothetical protein
MKYYLKLFFWYLFSRNENTKPVKFILQENIWHAFYEIYYYDNTFGRDNLRWESSTAKWYQRRKELLDILLSKIPNGERITIRDVEIIKKGSLCYILNDMSFVETYDFIHTEYLPFLKERRKRK